MYNIVEKKRDEMEKRTRNRNKVKESKSYTLPSSPSHSFSSSSSSSDFEFTISISPRKSSNNLCPADELFYKGQLLPLHLSPRISMVRTLLLSSSSTSSSITSSSTAPRDSTGSTTSNDSNSSFISDFALFPDSCDSSRPSSVNEDDELKRLNNHNIINNNRSSSHLKKTNKYFSLSRFSSVFRKETVAKSRETEIVTKSREEAETVVNDNSNSNSNSNNSSVKRMSVTAKEVIRKYFKKVKPLYEKFSQKQQLITVVEEGANRNTTTTVMSLLTKTERSEKESMKKENNNNNNSNVSCMLSHSFSGNLRYPRKRNCVSSCPSSMRSSPSHSGVLSQKGVIRVAYGDRDASSMEELRSAIQGAIAHCKNSLIQN